MLVFLAPLGFFLAICSETVAINLVSTILLLPKWWTKYNTKSQVVINWRYPLIYILYGDLNLLLAEHYKNALRCDTVHDTHSHVPFSSQVLCLFLILRLVSFSVSHTFPLLSVLLSTHSSLFLSPALRQTGSVRSGQVISGLIGRLMFLQKPGTLTCLSSSLMHFLPKGKSQTCWRLAETQSTVLFEDFSQPIEGRDDTGWWTASSRGNHKQSESLSRYDCLC